MSRTPYEVRLDLLKLASEILQTPIFQKREALLDEYHSRREVAPEYVHAAWSPIPFPQLPEFPTTDQIIAEAEKLNQFVSQPDRN